jgi:ribosome-binding protein aMBF1 (putative translation factor)
LLPRKSFAEIVFAFSRAAEMDAFMRQIQYNDAYMRQESDFTSLQVREFASRLGERIRLARKARKLSLQRLEQMCRIHRTTLGRLERGDTGVSLGVFLTVLESLKELSDVELILSQPQALKDKRKASTPILDADF